MDIKQSKLIKLIPAFMREDGAVKGLAGAIDTIIAKLDTDQLRSWDTIDQLNGEALDDLAWELNVLWYNAAGTIEQRREQIKTSDEIWRKLGTRAAVEQVINLIFGNAELLEFWEYEDGAPHHFKIVLDVPGVLTAENEKEFRRILEIVKRKSQILDAIQLVLIHDFNIYAAPIIDDVSTEIIQIKQKQNEFIGPYPYAGLIIQDISKEII